jgi:hypothetical protein
VRLPAIAEADERHGVETALGRQRFSRSTGEALHVAREALPMLGQIRHVPGFVPGIGE